MRFLIFLFSVCALNFCACDNFETSGTEVFGNGSEVTETQHATCRIATEEIVANAQATVTRVLTGVCNAKTVDERFEKLEKILKNQILEIKSMLATFLTISQKNRESEELVRKNSKKSPSSFYVSDPRQEEIDRFNNTIRQIFTSNGLANVFTYYWRIDNCRDKLSVWKPGHSQRSSTFNVSPGGYAMYLRFTPNHVPDGNVYVNVGLTRGHFDPVLKWPFPLRHYVEILDHSMGGRQEDLTSKVWDPTRLCSGLYSWIRPKTVDHPDNPECVGFSISKHIILSNTLKSSASFSNKGSKYLWDNYLIIKLTVYL